MAEQKFSRKKQMLDLFVNAAVFASVSVIASIGIFSGAGEGQVGDGVVGLGYFKPFTMDSNILAGVSALIMLIFGIRNLVRGEDTTPKWAAVLQLMAAACLSLTMLVAACFLAPIQVLEGRSYFIMFSDDMFFFHLVNPLLAILSFTCLRKKHRLPRRECILGAIPTVIYSFVYLTMVVIVKCWNDFYGFTFDGRYYMIPAVFIVIYSVVLAASLLLIRGHNRERYLS